MENDRKCSFSIDENGSVEYSITRKKAVITADISFIQVNKGNSYSEWWRVKAQ